MTGLSDALAGKAAAADVTAIQNVIPSTASASNKLVAASDIQALDLSIVSGKLCVTFEE